MANTPKKQGNPGRQGQPGTKGQPNRQPSRRDTIEAMRRQQKSAERRKTLLIVGVAALIGIALIAAVAIPAVLNSRNDPSNRALSSFGVAAATADCDEVATEPIAESTAHVGPGTDQPDKTTVQYATVPPTTGEHFLLPGEFARGFYTADDRPPMEELVHRLEHGHTILWYAADVTDEERQTLEDLSERVSEEDSTNGKFIVSAWDDAYGELPEGKRFALSHWGTENGYRQLCGAISGEAVGSFVDAYPVSNSPEPNAP